MSTADPLSELLVDAMAVDRARIATALKGRLAVDSSSGQVVPQAGFDRLNARQKLLAFLLARKVAVLLEVGDKDAAGPGEIADQTGLPPGTVRPTLSGLVDDHLVAKRGSSYYLSSPQIGSAIDLLDPETEKNTPNAGSRAGRRRRGRQKRSPASSKKNSETSPSSTPRAKPKPAARATVSPSALVMELVGTGFFSEPKTLNDVQKHIKDKRGHSIPTTTLSPIFVRLVRAGDIEREKNADGVYAYERTRSK